MNRFTRSHILAVACSLVLLTACVDVASETATDVPEPSAETTAQSTSATATPAPSSNGSTGGGMAISRSDVASIPDSPITSGEVAFIPEEHASTLGDAEELDPADPSVARHTSFQLDESRLLELDGQLASIDGEGRFALDLPSGGYLVCLANVFPGHSEGAPYAVVGCDLTSVVADATLTVTHGEGGVQASQE